VVVLEPEPQVAPDTVTMCMTAQHSPEAVECPVDTEDCLQDMVVHNLVLVMEVRYKIAGTDLQGKTNTMLQGDGVVGPHRHTCHLRYEQVDTVGAVYPQQTVVVT
jgi:hypothetical protein